MPLMEQDAFFYFGEEGTVEDLTKYRRGGLHPVHLGDVLPKPGTCKSDEARRPRYRISQKLGFGAFSTVWLARDLLEKRHVALKVTCGSDTPHQSSEARILRHISQKGAENPGCNNIIRLFDDFIVQGPNGFHECLVTEVVLPLDGLSAREKWSAQNLTRQLLSAFEFLHGEGVVHGDPNYANFGVAIPELQAFDEETITEYFANPQIIPVVPRDPSFQRDSVPSYVTDSVSIQSFIKDGGAFPENEDVCLKVLDFGRAYWEAETPKELPGAAPPTIRPPEVQINMLSNGRAGSSWSKGADIWAIGCIAYRINAGALLQSGYGNSEYQLYHSLWLGGKPPADWSAVWDMDAYCKSTESFKQPLAPSPDTEEAWERRLPKGHPRGELLLDFVRQMIKTEPASRSPPGRLLGHPFLSSGD